MTTETPIFGAWNDPVGHTLRELNWNYGRGDVGLDAHHVQVDAQTDGCISGRVICRKQSGTEFPRFTITKRPDGRGVVTFRGRKRVIDWPDNV